MEIPSYALGRSPADFAAHEDIIGEFGGERQRRLTLPRIGVIRNLRSHRNKGSPPASPALSGVSVAAPHNRTELQAALARFAAEDIGILVIDGGDGTIRDVLTCAAPVFAMRWPQIIVVPKGKTNALAVDLGLPSQWSLDEALQAARDGRVVRRRPLLVERQDGSRPTLWGFIFGTGAFNAAIATGQVAHRHGAFQSFAIGVTAVMGLAQALFGIGQGPWRRSVPMRFQADPGGAELPHSGTGPGDQRYFALFSTLRTFPLGIRPFRQADRGIRYLILDAALRRVVARVPAILRGVHRPGYAEIGIHRGAGEAFSIALEDGFILDGESFPSGRLHLRQGPELQFITP